MESRPRKRWSKELPPYFSELMNKLSEDAASFIDHFDNNEPEMREILVRKLRAIADELYLMQKKKDRERKIGVAAAALTGIVAAPLTRRLSLVGAVVVAAAAAVVGGGFALGYINVRKKRLEKQSVKEVEDLGEEFKKIIEPIKETLEEIKTTCEKLEETSPEAQTENTLRDVVEFNEIFRRVSELKKRSQGVLDAVVAMIQMIKELLVFIVAVFKITSTPEEDQKLRAAIIQSADQSQKVISDFERMKKALREFTERDELQSEENET